MLRYIGVIPSGDYDYFNAERFQFFYGFFHHPILRNNQDLRIEGDYFLVIVFILSESLIFPKLRPVNLVLGGIDVDPDNAAACADSSDQFIIIAVCNTGAGDGKRKLHLTAQVVHKDVSPGLWRIRFRFGGAGDGRLTACRF